MKIIKFKELINLGLVLLMILYFGRITYAQKSHFSTLSTIGVTTRLLDSGLGYHMGMNPTYLLSSKVSIEGQISYLYTKITSSFLSGKERKSQSINTLAGGRFYLNSEERTNRFYLNLLIGLNYNKEEFNNVKQSGEFGVGLSGGGFFEFNKFVIGLSYDTPQNLVLKAGYVF